MWGGGGGGGGVSTNVVCKYSVLDVVSQYRGQTIINRQQHRRTRFGFVVLIKYGVLCDLHLASTTTDDVSGLGC